MKKTCQCNNQNETPYRLEDTPRVNAVLDLPESDCDQSDIVSVARELELELCESLKKNQIELDQIFNIDELKNNSVIVLRFDKAGEWILGLMQRFSDKYGEILKSKNCIILLLGKDDSLDTVNEKEMFEYGWQKVEKKRIITL